LGPQETVMPRDRDDDSGMYTDAYSDDDFITAIAAEDGVAGTGEIADRVGCSRRQALNRLKELESNGDVSSKKAGRSLIWLLTD